MTDLNRRGFLAAIAAAFAARFAPKPKKAGRLGVYKSFDWYSDQMLTPLPAPTEFLVPFEFTANFERSCRFLEHIQDPPAPDPAGAVGTVAFDGGYTEFCPLPVSPSTWGA